LIDGATTRPGPAPRRTDEQIIEALQRHGTLTAAAQALGYSRQTLSEIVNGKRRPRVRRRLEALAAAESVRTDLQLDRIAPLAFTRLAQKLQDGGKAGDWAAAEILRLWAIRKREQSRSRLMRRLAANHRALQPVVNTLVSIVVQQLPRAQALQVAQALRRVALQESAAGDLALLPAPVVTPDGPLHAD